MKYVQYFKPLSSRAVLFMVTAPFIYIVFIPVILLDIFVELYHRICFPVYGLPLISRKKYIRIDRHKLKYLSFVQRINCAYCGYVNGFFAYAVAIASETEKFWCSIRHKEIADGYTPKHHRSFIPYNDVKSFKKYTSKKEKKD